MRVRTAAAIGAGVIALAGCAASSQQATTGGGGSSVIPSAGGTTTGPSIGGTASMSPPSSAMAKAAAASCPTSLQDTDLNAPAARPVPAGLPVSFVLRCKILTTGGTASTLVAERSTSDPATLIAALQAPTVPRAKVVCPMYAVQLPFFALVETNGTTLVPKIPLDNCGKPQNAVLTALNLMQFTEITSRPLK